MHWRTRPSYPHLEDSWQSYVTPSILDSESEQIISECDSSVLEGCTHDSLELGALELRWQHEVDDPLRWFSLGEFEDGALEGRTPRIHLAVLVDHNAG